MSRIGVIVAIVAVLTGFALGGCRSVVYVPEGRVTHDSVYVAALRVDSVYWRDSVFVAQRGDTVTVTREKYRYRYKLLRDTVWVERVDSVTVNIPVQVEKPMRINVCLEKFKDCMVRLSLTKAPPLTKLHQISMAQ